ncbi:MAG: 16S rRNA (guanine(966)-N(2))-methyltransferase RsmD [Brevinematia bacterium]
MLRISGGYLRNRRISVRNKSVRPTSEVVRQSIFNFIDVSNALFLDLFCGSGIVGIEAISRGAKFVCFVDNNPSLIKQLKSNLISLQIPQEGYRVICSSWERGIDILRNEGESFDLIFVDPFYDFADYRKVITLSSHILKRGGTIVLEHSSRKSLEVPSGFEIAFSRAYGETEVLLLRMLQP